MIEKTAVNMGETRAIDYLDSDSMPEIFADGLSGVLLGYPTMKMTFHSVLSAGESEIRRNSLVLTMDVHSALEMALDILELCKDSEEQLMHMASTAVPSKLKELLKKVPGGSPSTAAKRALKTPSKTKTKVD